MIRGHYLVLARRPGGPAIRQLARQITPRLALRNIAPVFETGRLIVFTDAGLTRILSPSGDTIILGNVYDRAARGAKPIADATAMANWRLSDEPGVRPPPSVWGDFLTFSDRPQDDHVVVARSAFGGLPCYFAMLDGVMVIASHVELLAEAGLVVQIDWLALLEHLANINLRSVTTCLAGVTELLPGRRLTIAAPARQADNWSPWAFAAKAHLVLDPVQAAEALRATIRDSVGTLASKASHLILGLSGGLDSSIVAAALAETGMRFSCLNLVNDDPSGDERAYARIVAAHFGVELVEAVEETETVDIFRSEAASLPRPVARAFAQSGDRLNRALAADVGGDAFISGGGGDNVFCYLESARPVADRLLFEGVKRGVLRTARDMSDLTDSTIWSALRKGIRRAWIQDHHYVWPNDHTLLSASAAAIAGPFRHHAWTTVPKGELPGKAQHIAWVLGIQNHIEGYGREHIHQTIWPLLSQPVIELCLQIPTWYWFDRGENRVVARRAFADILPPEIIHRRSKGTPDSFVVDLFERNRRAILPFLADGLLAGQGLIDREAVIAMCQARGLIKGLIYWRVMGLVDAEAWARHWHDRQYSGPLARL